MDHQQRLARTAAEHIDVVGAFEVADRQRRAAASLDRGQPTNALDEMSQFGERPAAALHVEAQNLVAGREGMAIGEVERDFGDVMRPRQQLAVIVKYALRPAEGEVGNQHQDG